MISKTKLALLSSEITKRIIQFILQKKVSYKKNIIFKKNVSITLSNEYEGFNYFNRNTVFTGSKIGYGSYLGENCFIKNTKIGRFTSIGENVKCIIGKHPSSKFVSTHPAFFSLRKQAGFTFVDQQLFEEFSRPLMETEKFTISIGNDVWIGYGVSIMDGITIGDGAIIAAHSLVTKDVPPYTIVGGLPAKEIKKRFEDKHIAFLLKYKWWLKDLNWIKANVNNFSDIETFYKKNTNE